MAEIRDTTAAHPIGVVREVTGLSERQIRYYERSGLLEPRRTRGGHRLYSRFDIDRLLRVKRLRERGMTLERIRKQLEEEERNRGRISEENPPEWRGDDRHVYFNSRAGLGVRLPEKGVPGPGRAVLSPAEDLRDPATGERSSFLPHSTSNASRPTRITDRDTSPKR